MEVGAASGKGNGGWRFGWEEARRVICQQNQGLFLAGNRACILEGGRGRVDPGNIKTGRSCFATVLTLESTLAVGVYFG